MKQALGLGTLMLLPLLSCATARRASDPGEQEVDGYATVGDVRLHYVSRGSGPLILFVHGFPEFWYAWRNQLAEFGRDHQAVAFDMRGYNLSSRPQSVEAYQVPKMVEDIRALADQFGARKFILVGHDWGGAIAWAFAIAHPERLEKLVIINAPHPAIFGRELANNPAQQKASQYMTMFRTPGAEATLSANNYATLMRFSLADVVASGHLTPADSAEYIKAWSQPGALTGGLNYYRAMGIRPPAPVAAPAAVSRASAPDMIVRVPTMVIWGERDPFLLTGNLDGLDAYVPSLVVKRIPDATHWVVHERPAEVNALIRAFIAAGPLARDDSH